MSKYLSLNSCLQLQQLMTAARVSPTFVSILGAILVLRALLTKCPPQQEQQQQQQQEQQQQLLNS